MTRNNPIFFSHWLMTPASSLRLKVCVDMGACVKPGPYAKPRGGAVDNFLIRARDRVIRYLDASPERSQRFCLPVCAVSSSPTGGNNIDCNDTSPRSSILSAQCSQCV